MIGAVGDFLNKIAELQEMLIKNDKIAEIAAKGIAGSSKSWSDQVPLMILWIKFNLEF